ncbi:helix-turn-helix domain-containing protein [Lentzea sp. CA-135723]|uniref:helix-turn-helix domain-containing protein n=1 Tax=Lentzea sp. CA-135723 TaxID=3239950 RepID=UPI003D8D2AB9
MTGVRDRREQLGMTQGEAATKAGISLATWRRMETDDDASFRQTTVRAVEHVLRLPRGGLALLKAGGEPPPLTNNAHARISDWIKRIASSFDGDPLTPRQAFKITMCTAGMEDDAFVQWDDYMKGDCGVDDLWMLSELPDWVLFIANNVWLQRFRTTIEKIGRRIDSGEVPYPRCMAEQVALAIVLDHVLARDADLEEDMIQDDDETSALLGHHGDIEDDWEQVEEALFDGDLDFKMIWMPDFTRMIYGSIDSPYLAWHPHRWWEQFFDGDENDAFVRAVRTSLAQTAPSGEQEARG